MFKWFVQLALILFSIQAQAQRVRLSDSSVLVYNVEEWDKKYTYTVTLGEYNDSVFNFQWKTNGKPVYKGVSFNEDFNYELAERLLIKPNNESEEYLDETSTRLFVPETMLSDIENAEDTIVFGIDNADAVLAWQSIQKKVRTVIYNSQPVNFEYREYRDRNLGLRIGFLPYNARNYWVYYYKDENMTMQLVEVKTKPKDQ